MSRNKRGGGHFRPTFGKPDVGEVSQEESVVSDVLEDEESSPVNAMPDLLREPPGPIDGANPTQGGTPKREEQRRPKFSLEVAANKSVTSRRGQLKSGDEVRESDFTDDVLARLIEIGCVIDSRV
jgi:hypothetical protein